MAQEAFFTVFQTSCPLTGVLPMEEKKKPGPPAEYRWKPGQSGNPGGRPKGSGKIQRKIQREAEQAAMIRLATDARQLLQDNSLDITRAILSIALKEEERPTQAKVKCLLACFERIVPALKVVEVKDNTDGKRPAEMTDAEILDLMERMVEMAQLG
jgi:hypothetical protein